MRSTYVTPLLKTILNQEIELTDKAGVTDASALLLVVFDAAEIGRIRFDCGAAGTAGEEA